MVLKVHFDASFIPETHVSGISVIIRTEDGKLIVQSSKKIMCLNNNEAELRALNKAIGYINDKQYKGLIPTNCKIEICGDNRSVIEISRKMHRMKGIEKGLMLSFLKQLENIKQSNEVILLWVLRNKNRESHAIAKSVLNRKSATTEGK